MTESIIITDNYVGVERRKYAKTLEQLELDILDMFKRHEERESTLIKELRSELLSGFPDDDLEGHFDYHSSKIKAAQAEEKFWHTATDIAIQQGISGVFAALKWIVMLSIVALGFKIGLGPVMAKIVGMQP